MSSTEPLTDDEIGIPLSSAITAPSMHNTQPWRFEVGGTVVDVVLDKERTLPAEDPGGRLIRIGLGAAAFNVRVAAAMLGHEARYVADPDPVRPDIAARLFLADRNGPAPLAELYAEVRRRHTYRGPMSDLPVAEPVRQRIADAARREGGMLSWLSADQRERLLGVLLEADVLERRAPDRIEERSRWIGGERDRDGVPDTTLGPRPATFPTAFRDLAEGLTANGRQTATFESSPQLAVLSTAGDDPADWLAAGMALQSALLTATSCQVSASFVNQPLEHAPIRALVRELIGGAARPQMIIRLGYPTDEEGRTPRRDWHDTLVRRP